MHFIKVIDEIPTNKKYYKVFIKKDGKLYFPMRNIEGDVLEDINTMRVKEGWLTSNDIGFHVWKNKTDAKQFEELIKSYMKIFYKTQYTTIIKKVDCFQHKGSGFAITGSTKPIKNKMDFCWKIQDENNFCTGISFTFKHIKVIDKLYL